MTVYAAVRPGMPVGFALIFWVCHVVPSSGERILLPRPQNEAVHRHIRKVANEFSICISLLQHSAPQFPLRRDNWFVRPDRLRPPPVAVVVHGSRRAFRAKIVLWRGESPLQTISLAVKPVPPVEETNLIRKNFACTLATVRASPVVAVVVSIVWYSASTSAIAP